MKFSAAVLATVAAAATEKAGKSGDICDLKDYEASGATAQADLKAAWMAKYQAATVSMAHNADTIKADEAFELRWEADNSVCMSWYIDLATTTIKSPWTTTTTAEWLTTVRPYIGTQFAATDACSDAKKAATQTASLTKSGSNWEGFYAASEAVGDFKVTQFNCWTAAADISSMPDEVLEMTLQTVDGFGGTVDATKDRKFTFTMGQVGGSLLLWLFIILLLGGGGGAAYYFMVIAPTM